MTKALCLIALLLATACSPVDSLRNQQLAQERYEMVVRECRERGMPVYIERHTSRAKRKLTRWEMKSAKCARLD